VGGMKALEFEEDGVAGVDRQLLREEAVELDQVGVAGTADLHPPDAAAVGLETEHRRHRRRGCRLLGSDAAQNGRCGGGRPRHGEYAEYLAAPKSPRRQSRRERSRCWIVVEPHGRFPPLSSKLMPTGCCPILRVWQLGPPSAWCRCGARQPRSCRS